MYVAIYKGRKQIYRQDNPSPFALLGWMGYLDGNLVTELVVASPTVQLNLKALGQEIQLSFSGDTHPNQRTVTVSRSTAVEMALYFLKNEGLPPE
jgi:hypothetical protein